MNRSIWKIIAKNTFTLFNLVNVILAVMVALVGSYKNMLFILIAIANTLISIINGIRAQRIVDKMRLLAEQRPTIIKNGKTIQVDPDAVAVGDTVVLSLGDQIMYDSILQSGQIEVNESFITGEQNSIAKHPGDQLTSGSFVVSGAARAKVEHIGNDNFVNKLQQEATTIKTADSKLFKLMNNIVKYISIALIPIGGLLLWSRFRTESDATVAVTSTVAGLINMIPEGLILLTSSVLALATIRLSKKKVLVQDLYAIETLARVDTICLDKTGTLTTGRMKVTDLIPVDSERHIITNVESKAYTHAKDALETALKLILSTSEADNATSTALKQKLLKTAKYEPTEHIQGVIAFSSERKYSGVFTDKATYLMGAPEFLSVVVPDFNGHKRVLAVLKCSIERGARIKSRGTFATTGANDEASPMTTVVGAEQTERLRSVSRRRPTDDLWSTGTSKEATRESILTPNGTLLGFVLLEDEIRQDAKEIINYFHDNNVAVKIISGDNLGTVTTIAETVGARDLRGVDLSTIKSPSYSKLVREYSIFTRVTPSQKKRLIAAFKKQGNTVAMTGDGVNDILAMKEADVSIAIGEGSDAARRAAKFVLLNSGFEAVPSIISEGRQSINNLERSTSLFLAKTVYASILAVLFVILPLSYPYAPIEMSLLNFACIGLPGLVLALEPNIARIKNQFVRNIINYSVPAGLTVSATMVTLAIVASLNNFPRPELLTASLFITFAIDLALLYQISKPLNLLRTCLIIAILTIVVGAFAIPLTRNLLDLGLLSLNSLIVTISLASLGLLFFTFLRLLATKYLHSRNK